MVDQGRLSMGKSRSLFTGGSQNSKNADVAKLVYALDLGSSGATRESSSLSVRTITHCF